jgi:hypothetical protein
MDSSNDENKSLSSKSEKKSFTDKAKAYIESNAKMVLGIIAVLVLIIIVLSVILLNYTGKLNIPFMKKKSKPDESDSDSGSD